MKNQRIASKETGVFRKKESILYQAATKRDGTKNLPELLLREEDTPPRGEGCSVIPGGKGRVKNGSNTRNAFSLKKAFKTNRNAPRWSECISFPARSVNKSAGMISPVKGKFPASFIRSRHYGASRALGRASRKKSTPDD
jgi:hypothetical protein